MSYAQTVLSDNPAGYWRLADLSDSSGNGFPLTTVEGVVDDVPSLLAAEPGANQAKQFLNNTGADALSRPDTPELHLTNDHTVEAWLTSAYTGEPFDAVQMTDHFRLRTGVGHFRGVHYTTDGYWQLDGATVIASDTPYHVVLVKEGTTQRLYVNGVLDGSNTLEGVPRTNSNPFCIGAHAGITNGWWGKVDEVAIYTHALSPSRIQAHYAAGSDTGVNYVDGASGTIVASGSSTEFYGPQINHNISVPGPVTATKLPHTVVWGETKFTKGIGVGATIRPEGLFVDRNIAPFDIPSSFSVVGGGRKWIFHDSGTVIEPAPTTGQIWPRRRHGN